MNCANKESNISNSIFVLLFVYINLCSNEPKYLGHSISRSENDISLKQLIAQSQLVDASTEFVG